MKRRLDLILLILLITGALIVAGRAWLHDHPQHDPWAPLELDDPIGWATARKIAAMQSDPAECRVFLERSDVAFEELDPVGQGECRREDRIILLPDNASGHVLSPARSSATCSVNAGLALWLKHGVQPAAEDILGSRVIRIEHLGTHSCRRIGGGDTGRWSEHATGNAIDIAAFILADGRRISVLRGWNADPKQTAFLKQIRDEACSTFATVLSPDYNAAHADHFHLDQAGRTAGWSLCR